MILLSGKRVLESARDYARRPAPATTGSRPDPDVGNYRSTVGILSASLIGRRVIELLRPYDLDGAAPRPVRHRRGGRRAGRPARVAAPSSSPRATWSASTPLCCPRPGAWSSRELLAAHAAGRHPHQHRAGRGRSTRTRSPTRCWRAASARSSTSPSPRCCRREHPLWDCDNALITPHLAGSQGNELRRLADLAVARGRPLGLRRGLRPSRTTRKAGVPRMTAAPDRRHPAVRTPRPRTASRARYTGLHPRPLGGRRRRAAAPPPGSAPPPAGALLDLPGRPSRSGGALRRAGGLRPHLPRRRVPRRRRGRQATRTAGWSGTPTGSPPAPARPGRDDAESWPLILDHTVTASRWSSPPPSRSGCG